MITNYTTEPIVEAWFQCQTSCSTTNVQSWRCARTSIDKHLVFCDLISDIVILCDICWNGKVSLLLNASVTSYQPKYRTVQPSPCTEVCNAATYQNARCSYGRDRIHRDTVFFKALFASILDIEITAPFYSEHCVLHLHRREEWKGLELQSLAHGEEAKKKIKDMYIRLRKGVSRML